MKWFNRKSNISWDMKAIWKQTLGAFLIFNFIVPCCILSLICRGRNARKDFCKTRWKGGQLWVRAQTSNSLAYPLHFQTPRTNPMLHASHRSTQHATTFQYNFVFIHVPPYSHPHLMQGLRTLRIAAAPTMITRTQIIISCGYDRNN